MSITTGSQAAARADGAFADGPFLRLPGASFLSFEEYSEFRRQNEALLTTRWLRDRSFATTGQAVVIEGCCGICLRPATFRATTQGGELVSAGLMPNWRETQACDCESQLIGRERAALQYALGNLGVEPWYRALVLGRASSVPAVLDGFLALAEFRNPFLEAAETTLRGRQRGMPGRHQLILMLDVLHRTHNPADLLADCAESLTAGGTLVFTTPFHADSAQSLFSVDQSVGAQHRFGWDILRLALEAGFRRSAAYLYWSEEFGYLGALNFIFTAAL